MSAAQTTGNISLNAIDTIAPTILAFSLSSNNAYIDITFSEGIFTDTPASAPVVASDFTLTFVSNNGTSGLGASNVTISSLTKNTNGSLIGGESVIRVNLSVIGNPTGLETIEIKPATNSSVYDASGNAMSTGQTTGQVHLVTQSYSASANAVFALMPDAIPTNTKAAMATFIDSQVLSGNWTKLDVFEFYGLNTVNNALKDWKGNATASNNGAVWNSGSNFQTDGAASYVNTGYTPTTVGTQYTQTDAQFGVTIKEWNHAAGVTKAAVGSVGTSQSYLSQSSTNVVGRLINSTASFSQTAALTALVAGTWAVSRSAGNSFLYQDGSLIDTDAQAQGVELNAPFFVGARRNGGSADLYANGKFTAFWGGAHTGFDYANFYTNLSTLIAEIGA
jgi:hypothetical protein